MLSPTPGPGGIYHACLAAQGTDGEEIKAWASNMMHVFTEGRETYIRDPIGVRSIGLLADGQDGQEWFSVFARFSFRLGAAEKIPA